MNSYGLIISQEENTFDVRLNHNRIQNVSVTKILCRLISKIQFSDTHLPHLREITFFLRKLSRRSIKAPIGFECKIQRHTKGCV